MSRRSRHILRKRGKAGRLKVFPGADVPKVAWEFGNWNFHGSARYRTPRGSTFLLIETRWYHE
jgi:hypothetical protein